MARERNIAADRAFRALLRRQDLVKIVPHEGCSLAQNMGSLQDFMAVSQARISCDVDYDATSRNAS